MSPANLPNLYNIMFFLNFFCFPKYAENTVFRILCCEKNKMDNAQIGYCRVEKTGKIKKNLLTSRALQLADELLHSIPISEHRRGVNSHMAVDN